MGKRNKHKLIEKDKRQNEMRSSFMLFYGHRINQILTVMTFNQEMQFFTKIKNTLFWFLKGYNVFTGCFASPSSSLFIQTLPAGWLL